MNDIKESQVEILNVDRDSYIPLKIYFFYNLLPIMISFTKWINPFLESNVVKHWYFVDVYK